MVFFANNKDMFGTALTLAMAIAFEEGPYQTLLEENQFFFLTSR